ncbi:MAG: PqqD family protein [Actinomycetota bacterium]|nr:PqqD family protein [Actinomycetota bacterium]
MSDPTARPGPLRVRPTEGVFAREVDGELVLLHPQSGRYYGLDRVGLAMWEALGEGGSVAAARARLLGRFDVEPGRLDADLQRLVGELEREGLVDVDRG